MDPRLETAVRRARLGDPRAFRELTEIIGPDLVRFLTFFLNGDGHAAHDVAQETILRAWDAMPTVRDGQHLRRWCYKVARYRAISRFRKRTPKDVGVGSVSVKYEDGRENPRPAPPSPEPPNPAGLRIAVQRAVRNLPATYVGPVHLHYVQGCSTRETAELLGITQSAVKMRLFRARRILRKDLGLLDLDRPAELPPPERRTGP